MYKTTIASRYKNSTLHQFNFTKIQKTYTQKRVNFSSAKSPAGALELTEENDMAVILDKLKEY